ncbi:MAG: hypothetical protein QNJ54_05470 [Prochloraceae cyanobacterium]|nr:hypothetical protein [Prochloraceae cyanobacterium]
MQLADKKNWEKNDSFGFIKNFLIWTFTLTVSLLVVGFPVGFVLVSIGVLMVIVLHSVVPASAVLLVTGGIVALNILTVIVGAAILTFKGINPREVSWLSWLHGDAEPSHESVYASCPLTCELDK